MITLQIDSLMKFNSEGFRKFRLDIGMIETVIDLIGRVEENVILL